MSAGLEPALRAVEQGRIRFVPDTAVQACCPQLLTTAIDEAGADAEVVVLVVDNDASGTAAPIARKANAG